MNKKVEGLIRHVLTFIGGLFITKGFIDESTLQEVIGALITLGGFVWSYVDKKDKPKDF